MARLLCTLIGVALCVGLLVSARPAGDKDASHEASTPASTELTTSAAKESATTAAEESAAAAAPAEAKAADAPKSIPTINKHADRDDLVWGDIVLSEEQKIMLERMTKTDDTVLGHISSSLAFHKFARPWPNATIPYRISKQYSAEEIQVITRALAELSAKSCWKFVDLTKTKTNDLPKSYVDVKKIGGCYSWLGTHDEPQDLSLGNGCVWDYIVQHEFMHAMGFVHEHQRPDRDDHITIIANNIQKGQDTQFTKLTLGNTTMDGIPYSEKSIMHYDSGAFAIDTSKPTMLTRKGEWIERNRQLTALDVSQLKRLGNCKS